MKRRWGRCAAAAACIGQGRLSETSVFLQLASHRASFPVSQLASHRPRLNSQPAGFCHRPPVTAHQPRLSLILRLPFIHPPRPPNPPPFPAKKVPRLCRFRIGAPGFPRFRWVARCPARTRPVGSRPPFYMIVGEGCCRGCRTPQGTDYVDGFFRLAQARPPAPSKRAAPRGAARTLPIPKTHSAAGASHEAPSVMPPVTWTFSRMVFCSSSISLGFFIRCSLAASRP